MSNSTGYNNRYQWRIALGFTCSFHKSLEQRLHVGNLPSLLHDLPECQDSLLPASCLDLCCLVQASSNLDAWMKALYGTVHLPEVAVACIHATAAA